MRHEIQRPRGAVDSDVAMTCGAISRVAAAGLQLLVFADLIADHAAYRCAANGAEGTAVS